MTTGLSSSGAVTERRSELPERVVSGAERSALRAGLMILAAVGVAVLLTYAAHYRIVQSSDSATPLLQAKAILRGNITLAHWTLSLDSFWTVEVPFYVIGVALLGPDPRLLNIVPGVVAGLVFLVGLALISDRRRDAGVFAGGLTLFLLLALPGPFLSDFLLRSGTHIPTTLYCLLAFLCLRRGRFDPGWFVGVALLAVAIQGDFLAVFLGLVPVAVAGLVAGARLRRWQAALPGLAGALGAGGLAAGLRALLVWAGVFVIGPANARATGSVRTANLLHTLTWGARLFGVGSSEGPWWLQAVHAIGIAVVVLALALALWRLLSGVALGRGRSADGPERWRTDDLLLLGAACSVCVLVALTLGDFASYARYLAPGLIFSAILAARLVARVASESRLSRSRPKRAWHALPLAALLVVVAIYPVGFVREMPRQLPVLSTDAIQDFLQAHHLRLGIGDYWDASIVTAESHGKVLIRPVDAALDPSRTIERYHRMSAADWYKGKAFQFFVFNSVSPWGADDEASAAKTFGTPSHTYHIGDYEVLTWNHPIRVHP